MKYIKKTLFVFSLVLSLLVGGVSAFAQGYMPPPATPQIPPTVTTRGATNIGSDTATLVAEINPHNMVATAWFEWSTQDLVKHSTDEIYNSPLAGGFTQYLSGLQPGATYYYKACGQNRAGTACGQARVFKTASVKNISVGTGTVTIPQSASNGTGIISSLTISAVLRGLAFLAVIVIAIFVAMKIFHSGH